MTSATAHAHRGIRTRLLACTAVPLLGLALLAGCTGTSKPLPSGYPSTAVPVASGEVTSTGRLGAGWTVEVRVADASAQKKALATLQSRGFQVIGQSATTGSSVAYSLASAGYSVRLELRNADQHYDVLYGVAPRTPSVAATPSPKSR